MATNYAFFPELLSEVEIPAKGILSRTLLNDERVRIVLFGFAQGEELSAHTAPVPAVLYFLKGEARVKLGEDALEARAGSLAHMAANLPHGILAKTPLVMLLVMAKS
jgi:quercetin dioxygenase-like cupin family protein